MSKDTGTVETADSADDEFDAAFEVAIKAAPSGEPAKAGSNSAEGGDAGRTIESADDELGTGEDDAAKKIEADAAAKKAAGDAGTDDAAKKIEADAAAKKIEADAAAKKIEADAAAEIKDPEWSAEDDTAWKAFEKDWPDHAANVQKKMDHQTALMEARFARTLLAVVTKVYQDFAPVVEGYQKVSTNSFRAAVLSTHEDYDAVAPQLETWIKAQPAYLQESMMRVYNGGSAEDLIDLVSRYKTASGVSESGANTQTSTDEAAKKAAAKKAEVLAAEAEARKKAAASTRPVAGTRATPSTAGVDPNDYDAAFDEAVAAQTA